MENTIYHHGIKGMKWGVRRYQNKDGSLTPKGKKRYSDGNSRRDEIKSNVKTYNKKYDEAMSAQEKADSKMFDYQEKYRALGRNKVERIINAARNKTKAAKDYNKAWEEWNKSQEIADTKISEMREAYKKTGRNAVSRVFNVARYGR